MPCGSDPSQGGGALDGPHRQQVPRGTRPAFFAQTPLLYQVVEPALYGAPRGGIGQLGFDVLDVSTRRNLRHGRQNRAVGIVGNGFGHNVAIQFLRH